MYSIYIIDVVIRMNHIITCICLKCSHDMAHDCTVLYNMYMYTDYMTTVCICLCISCIISF